MSELMRKRLFGSWGAELQAAEFGMALAALGVVRSWLDNSRGLRISDPELLDLHTDSLIDAVRSAIESRGRRYVLWAPSQTLFPPNLPAGKFVNAWLAARISSGSGAADEFDPPLRLATRSTSPEEFSFALDYLSAPEVGLASFARLYEPLSTDALRWDWPLKIGLLDDHRSRELKERLDEAIKNHLWAGELVSVEITPPDPCDILILPHRLTEAAQAALVTGPKISATCVLVVGRSALDSDAQLQAASLTLRAFHSAAGVILSHVYQSKQIAWFADFIRELSHAETIDVAAFRAARDAGVKAPWVELTRSLLMLSPVERAQDRLRQEIVKAQELFEMRGFRLPTTRALRLPQAAPPAPRYQSVVDSSGRVIIIPLPAAVENLRFDSEGQGATQIAQASTSLEAVRTELETAVRETRAIQARVFDAGNGEPLDRFPPGRTVRIPVRIAAPAKGWLVAPEVFPAERLPPDVTEHRLRVVFTEPHHSPEPQMAEITLPRDGDSTDCEFLLAVRSNLEKVEARIVVIHANRILQTALLKGDVDLPGAIGEKIHLEIEAQVVQSFAELDQRSKFGAALVLNHSSAGENGILKVANDRAAFMSPNDLDVQVKAFDDAFSAISDDAASYAGLHAEATTTLLRKVARQGRMLYQAIVSDNTLDDRLVASERIQVLSARPEARLPIEFFYDRPMPAKAAPVCPYASDALGTGECMGACPKGEAKSEVVCPIGFWGIRKIIERQAFVPGTTVQNLGGEYQFSTDPTRARKTLNALSSGIFAASNRVNAKDPGGTQKVIDKMTEVLATAPGIAPDWPDWKSKVGASSPTLLLMLPHNVSSAEPLGESELEIGGGGEPCRLPIGDLDAQYLRGEAATSTPLVMMLGCETGAAKISYVSFVSQLRRAGAAIVVSTSSTVLGRHVVPVTEALLEEMARLTKESPVPFGDVMRAVRRKLLAQGLPMVLCVMSYGDVDWQVH